MEEQKTFAEWMLDYVMIHPERGIFVAKGLLIHTAQKLNEVIENYGK